MAENQKYCWTLACTAAVAALALAGPVQAEHYEIVLLGGQSNMDGRAPASGLPTTPVNLQLPQADVMFYEGGSLRTLRPDSGTDFGPEVTFGRTVADAMPSSNLALIKYAVGGTSLNSHWDPTTGGTYASFKSTVSAGLAALSDGGANTYEITGMLWTQGESDINRTTLQYQTDLNEFIADVRTTYGSDLPFYISRLSDQSGISATPLANIRAAQENVATGDGNAYLIDTDGSAFSFKDSLHYDADGQVALGEAFAASYLATVPEPGTLVFMGLGGVFLFRRRRKHQ